MSFSNLCKFNTEYCGRFGAECEYWTVNPDRSGFVFVSPALFIGEHAPLRDNQRIKPELPGHQVETTTAVCRTVADIEQDLMLREQTLNDLGEEYGFVLDTSPTPQFPFETDVFPKRRYEEIKKRVPNERLRNAWITGLHGHRGCADIDFAIKVLNGLRRHLPMLAALSARSPTYMGESRGYASERIVRYMEMAPQMVPPHIKDVDHLDKVAHEQGFDKDPNSCWWFARINAQGTVEVRIMDMQEKPAHAAQLIALMSTLAHYEYYRASQYRPASSDTISGLIMESAKTPGQRKVFVGQLDSWASYADSVGLAIENRYIKALKARLE